MCYFIISLHYKYKELPMIKLFNMINYLSFRELSMMLYPKGPNGPVFQRYANFNKTVWMTMVPHFPGTRQYKSVIWIHAVFFGISIPSVTQHVQIISDFVINRILTKVLYLSERSLQMAAIISNDVTISQIATVIATGTVCTCVCPESSSV